MRRSSIHKGIRRIFGGWIPTPIIIYILMLLAVYALPIGLEGEWYNFYEYIDTHNAIPYIDTREGYPPLGFLVYMPLYYLSKGNRPFFYYLFRTVNGLLLASTIYTLYLTAKHILGEGEALRYSLYYGLLPSVIIANTYSNDIVSLLPASISIYTMLKGMPLLSGLSLGLAALGKGFPILLLIPALIYFEKFEDKVKLAGSAILIILYVSLPFLALNPFTYISTYTHHGSRGPWETIWALIDGYYSHGGFLHPYFDKFLYHDHLLSVYKANPYDHAFYRWRYSALPIILAIAQVASVAMIASTVYSRKLNPRILTVSCGVLYIAYILFFKGYSTQFAVSTPYYILLASTDNPLRLLIPLEVSHILQMLSWHSQEISPILRNMHREMLVSAIVIRTSVLAYATIVYFTDYKPSLRIMVNLARNAILRIAGILSGERLLCIIILATLIPVSHQIYGYTVSYSLRTVTGEITTSTSSWAAIHLEGLIDGDQVLTVFETNTWLEFQVLSLQPSEVERGIINPYNLKGSFNQSLLFFRAKSDTHTVWVKMKHPRIPFRVTDGLDSDLTCKIRYSDPFLIIELNDTGLDGSDSMFRIAYSYETKIDDVLILPFLCTITEGQPSAILLDIFDDRDEWLYTIRLPESLSSNMISCEKYPYILGDEVSLIALVVSLRDGTSTVIKLWNPNPGCGINLYAENVEGLRYTIFIERDFQLTPVYWISLSATVILSTALIYRIHRHLRNPSIAEEFRP